MVVPLLARKDSCGQAPLPRHCSPYLAHGRAAGEGTVEPLLLPGTPGPTSLRGKTRARAGPLHTSLLHSFPPPPPLAPFSNFPASSGRVAGGGVSSESTSGPKMNVPQQPTPPHSTRAGGPGGPAVVGVRAARWSPSGAPAQGGSKFVIISHDGGSGGMGRGEPLSIPSRALFSLVSLKVGC